MTPPDAHGPPGGGPEGNSAHPPIRPIDPDLTPEEFDRIFAAAGGPEVAVYGIICEAALAAGMERPIVVEGAVTLYRMEDDNGYQVGIRFSSAVVEVEGWLGTAPYRRDALLAGQDDQGADLWALANMPEGTLRLELDDLEARPAGVPLARLLELMETSGIGRPSTYATALEKLLGEGGGGELLEYDRATTLVSLTAAGREVGAGLEERCEGIGSLAFARAFDDRLGAMAAGALAPGEFLAWILALTRPGDARAEAALAAVWDSPDALRADTIEEMRPAGPRGGLIGDPAAAVAPPPGAG